MVKIYAVEDGKRRQVAESDAFLLIETGDKFCPAMVLNNALCDVYNGAAESREVVYGRALRILIERVKS